MDDRLSEILSPYKGKRDALIPILQKVQAELGYLPDEAMLEIARVTGLPESRVFAVASFYAQFRFTPRGKHSFMVCRGTACHVRGRKRFWKKQKELWVLLKEKPLKTRNIPWKPWPVSAAVPWRPV